MGKFSNPFVEKEFNQQNNMEATILPNGEVFEVWSENEVVFTDASKVECGVWANANGYTLIN